MNSYVQHLDENLLKAIHIGLANPILDSICMLIRNPYFWSPLYLFLLIFMYRHFGKQGLIWCLFFFITFVFCDYISAGIIKPFVHRIRPCNDPSLSFTIREYIKCGGGYSFPSSHASNHVGFAVYIIFTLKKMYKWIAPLAILWAASVCFAQMYAGVHYPSDIIGGAILGTSIGIFNAYYFTTRHGKLVA